MRLPLTILLRRSRRLLLTLVAVHLVALVLLWPLVLPLAVKVLLVLVIVVSAWRTLPRVARPGVTRLHLGRDGNLDLETPEGERLAARVRERTTAWPALVVLLLRLEDRDMTLTLPSDAMSRDDHRQLRLWLRWQTAFNQT